MTNSIEEGITGYLVRNGIITQDETEVYAFGIRAFTMQTIHVLVMVMIGIVFGKLIIAIEFIIIYSVLRTTAGGQHFKSRKLCFLTSCILMMLVMIFHQLFFTLKGAYVSHLILLCSGAIIWKLAPCDNENKKMNKEEKKYYARKARVVIIGLDVLYLMSVYKEWKCAYVILISLLLEAMGIVWGTLENNKQKLY